MKEIRLQDQQSRQAEAVELKIDYLKTVTYSLYHNHIPVCQSVEIRNTSDKPLTNLRLALRGEFFISYESEVIPQIGAGESIRLSAFELAPDPEVLSSLLDRTVSSFVLSLSSEGQSIFEHSYQIDLLPYDFWLGTKVMPQTIASFVTPNHPSVSAILLLVAEKLKKISGHSSLLEYQSGNPDEVRNQVAAVFAALHSLGIIYRIAPASFEEQGQRVVLPQEVLASKMGNCIELSVLFASVLEAIGIHSGIVLQQGHAFLAVWLVDDCNTCSVSDDLSFLEKEISNGIGEMLVLECTELAKEKADFNNALASAERELSDAKQFVMYIDILRCRLERILPLPSRVEVDGKWSFDTKGVKHDKCSLNLEYRDRYDLSKIADSSKQLGKFDIWERKLLDFSLRNTLLNLGFHRRAIQFISFDLGRIEDQLQDGEEYCILPKPELEFPIDTSGRLIRSKSNSELYDLVSSDIGHRRLHSYRNEQDTKYILKNIYRASRNAIEETGANSLFLTIGALRWYESSASETARYAPILLMPVEMVYKKGRYYIRSRDEEMSLNITLLEFLSQNFNIRIKGLDALPRDEHGVDVALIFTLIRDALKDQKRWDVEEECLLGVFSFSKFLMWNDIHNHRDQLASSRVVRSLVENRLTWVPQPAASSLKELDSTLSPAELALPMPIDSSQMAAVLEAARGNSFILYGPPGTGKSQTITNLISNALYHGKRVLFVAEKMAALSVVQSRLVKIGLDPFCLELHSNKSTKRHVLQQLGKALKVAHIAAPAHYEQCAEKLFEQRRSLIAYMQALHEVDPSDDLSLYDCILHYEGILAPELADFRFSEEVDALLLREGSKAVEDVLGSRFETLIRLVGQPSLHPLNGWRIERSLLMKGEELTSDMLKAKQLISQAKDTRSELIQAGKLRAQILQDNSETILNEDAGALQRDWRAVKAKWFLPRIFAKGKFLSKLKAYNPLLKEAGVEKLIDQLCLYTHKHSKIEQIHRVFEQYFRVHLSLDELPAVSVLEESIAKLDRWAAHKAQMRDWLHWCEFSQELESKGLACVVEAMESSAYEPSEIRQSYLKALFKHKISQRMSRSEVLASFEGMLFDEKVLKYKQLSDEFQALTQRELYAKLAARIPRIADNIDNSSEIGLLSRNISNGGRGMSLRDLFEQLPTLMPRLCPCVLMSPMSVAQYLDLSGDKFDIVIFDEASQMPTSEAVGAIARGSSLIVVGDPKQMPPTSFFSSSNVDEEEAPIDDMESILEDCQTLGMPSLQLSWHYRSRHESLIAFSNNEYYGGSLITFPSADDQKAKLNFIPIDGCYDKGGKRQNKAEAEAVVKEIERRLKDEKLREKSIGVIAFSVAQQALIEDLLQSLLDSDKTLQDCASAMYEPIFVKNLENVQGDERDVILFSIGYGPDKNGKVSMNFGPLNNEGGERRLNVAVSRAREEMNVYSSMTAADIDLHRTKALGVKGLKHFLSYAQTHSLPVMSENQVLRQDNVVRAQIAEALSEKGYAVKTDVGRSHFKLDIAVGDAGSDVYKLGILLDGETYRDTGTTRDREIVQPSVLCALNWQIMRVWVVDWYNNPARVISRIEERLAACPKDASPAPPKVQFEIEEAPLEEESKQAAKYTLFEPSKSKAGRLSDSELLRRIVAQEQPVSFMYLCRRYCALRESGRVSPSVQKTVALICEAFHRDESNAIWLSRQDREGYSSYRPNSGRDVSDIPQIELCNAISECLKEQIAINEDSLILLSAKKLGFTRRGANVTAAFKSALAYMSGASVIEQIGENIRLRD